MTFFLLLCSSKGYTQVQEQKLVTEKPFNGFYVDDYPFSALFCIWN